MFVQRFRCCGASCHNQPFRMQHIATHSTCSTLWRRVQWCVSVNAGSVIGIVAAAFQRPTLRPPRQITVEFDRQTNSLFTSSKKLCCTRTCACMFVDVWYLRQRCRLTVVFAEDLLSLQLLFFFLPTNVAFWCDQCHRRRSAVNKYASKYLLKALRTHGRMCEYVCTSGKLCK